MKPHWIQTYRFIEDLALQKHSFRSGRMEKDTATEQIYGVGPKPKGLGPHTQQL